MFQLPRLAEWLLERFLSFADSDHRLGDFAVVFRCRVEDSGLRAARLWYWAQVLRSLPDLIKNSMYGSMGMIKNYFTIAFRNLRRDKVFSFINITGLAADYPEFEAVSRVIAGGNTIIRLDGDQKLRESFFYADSAFFQIFSFSWMGGDAEHALDAPYSVVLTEKLAGKIFGQDDPVGKTIRLDDDNDYQVTGLIGDVPANSHISFQLLLSSVTISAGGDFDPFTGWGDNWVPLYVLLQPEHSWQRVSDKIRFALKKYQGEESRHELYLRPLSRIHLHADVKHEIGLVGSIKNIYIFTAIALFVLVIAGINFMNLTTARSADRAREVGLRKVSGAQRSSLIRQFFPEEVFIYRFLDEDFNRMYQEERKSGRVILYLAALAIGIACLGLFGLASFATKKRTKEIALLTVSFQSLRAASANPIDSLRYE
jgi:hypothetical protein